jgi:hypothetical protein
MLNGSYVALGKINGDETYFQGRVKTTFMWSMTTLLQQQGKLQQALQNRARKAP